MSEDIKGIPTRDLDMAGCRLRSRNGAFVLLILAASILFQAVLSTMSAFDYAPDLINDAGFDSQSADLLGQLVIYYGLVAVVFVAGLFALFMQSRIAMLFGFLIFALDWVSIVTMWLSGRYTLSGLALNILGPIYLFIGLMAAFRYHKLRKSGKTEPDIAVFE